MKHEKIFTLKTGRLLKVILTEEGHLDSTADAIQIDVLVMDPKDEDFRLPISESHPQFWKLKRLDDQQARMLQVQYSGVFDKQIRKTMKEFKLLMREPELC